MLLYFRRHCLTLLFLGLIGAQNSGSLPPPPWEAQPADNGSPLAGGQYPLPPQYPQPPQFSHVQSSANHQGPQAMGYGQAGGMYMQPNANGHMSAVNSQVGSNQLGMHPQHIQGVAGHYMGHQTQGGPAANMYPQQMYGNQFAGYGYGQQQQQGVPYIEQQMYGMSVRDDSYLRNSNQGYTSYVPSGKPSKPEDKLFGDLVDMAKVKPKTTPGRAGSM